MRKEIFVCVVLLFLGASLSAKSRFAVTGQDPVRKVFTFNKKQYAITAHQLLLLKNDTSQLLYTLAGGINDAVMLGDEIAIASNAGLYFWRFANNSIDSVTSFAGERISCLAKDAAGKLWVGNAYKGCYRQATRDSFELKLNIPSILSMTATADSNVWVGTNIGLYRVAIRDFATTRYAEEGYSGYELPDNIVEKLFSDDYANIWVVMPDNLSFKKGSSFSGEMPVFDFVGERNNEVNAILLLDRKYYLFITQKGVSSLPVTGLNEHHHHATEEVHESHGLMARACTNAELQSPVVLRNEPILNAVKDNGAVWFITAKGCWAVSEQKLKKILSGRS
jgi:ligand-binding sensor domain-containing protein